MPVLDKYKRVKLEDIKVDREKRQRREVYSASGEFINDDGLLDSIRKHGVISPIVVRQADFTLCAGERRLEASRVLALKDVPCRFFEDLEPLEAQIIELEENARRLSLPWRDEVKTVADLHELYQKRDPKWARSDTSKALNYGQVEIALRIAQDLDSPRIADATSVRAAYNVLARIDERRIADAMSDITDHATGAFEKAGDEVSTAEEGVERAIPSQAVGGGLEGSPLQKAVILPESILNEDFMTWAEKYAGPRFNFLHCDFPYGIEAFNGPQSGRDKWITYGDDKKTYEKLIEVLCKNLDRLLAPSSHMMFWLSADVEIMWHTRQMFRALAPDLIFGEKPLIWHKTDNVGVLSDPKRGPRHVYEACLIASREDRPIVRAVSDTYGAPTDKAHHPSTKPEPVLRHFMQMFVDENTRLLDPTCGSGSALRAAESLGAKAVLGLEVSVEHADAARSALRSFRTLRRVSK